MKKFASPIAFVLLALSLSGVFGIRIMAIMVAMAAVGRATVMRTMAVSIITDPNAC
jgi:hypothetical protein